ncbi:MAG: hypothetical protein HZC42_14330 [Candidatus Eisenbacteria bacterium]|nr:hypothetical protein [Candidatus Eisenbacteria bacterium]
MTRFILALVIGLALAGGTASAAPEKIDAGNPTYFSGNQRNLPVSMTLTPQAAVQWAYTMPAVQAAVQEMQRRGYIAHPEYDNAVNVNDPPSTFVTLSFEKPGLTTPSNISGAPAIIIGTVLQPDGTAFTNATGGLAFVNWDTGLCQSAEEYPEFQYSDPSFDVMDYYITSTGIRRPLPQPVILGATDSPGDKKFRKFMGCTTIVAAGALVKAALTPPPIPQKVVIDAALTTIFGAIACANGIFN